MASANLTAARLRELLEYEPMFGTWKWRCDGRATGRLSSQGYVCIGIGGNVYRSHRLAWLYMTGRWPAWHVDHIDGNPSNNAWVNLRDVSRSVNLQNRHCADADNRSGLLGVCAIGSRWKSAICFNAQRRHLGTFDTKELAHAAYMAAKRALHPEAPISRSAADAPIKNGHPIGRAGLRGVRKIGDRWAAHLYDAGKQRHLGMFSSKEDAHRAHLEAKALLGHAGERVSDLYADARGAEPTLVKLGGK